VEGKGSLVATAAYQPEPTAAAAARRFVRDTLQSWLIGGETADGHGLVDDAVLLTSELVTNAVVHAGTPVEVTCKLTGGGVEVVVSDGHPARLVPEPPENEHVPAERTSGRGLLLPAALASAWGVTYGRAAKAVWFRIGQAGTGADLGRGNGHEDGLHMMLAPGLQPAADGGLGGQAALAAALRQVAPVTADHPAVTPGLEDPYRWPAPPFGEPGYQELLASTVESARVAVGAEAAYALAPDEDGDLRLRAVAGSFPAPDPSADATADGAARPGVPGARDHVPGAGSLAAARAAAGAAPSLLTVPFVVDGRVTGLLAVASATPDRFRDDETVRLQQFADRWGPPLERARLSELERIRRGRIGALSQARRLLAGDAGPDEIFALAGEAAVPRLVPWCAVLLPAGEAGLRTAYARHVDEARSAVLAWMLDRMPGPEAAGGPARPGAVARWPLAAAGLAEAPAGADALAGDTAWCFPLGGADRDAGVLAVGHHRDGRLPREVVELTADLASRIGVALGNATLVAQRS
jgi:anti-sigma regulatory factor (Ser/Thr protein kinase)/GAF domain-containing protein